MFEFKPDFRCYLYYGYENIYPFSLPAIKKAQKKELFNSVNQKLFKGIFINGLLSPPGRSRVKLRMKYSPSGTPTCYLCEGVLTRN